MYRKLDIIMAQIPPLNVGGKEYTPVFEWGNEDDLNKFLSIKRKSGDRYYPLIWLETPTEEATEVEFNFTIATLNRRTDLGNRDRLTYTYEPTLDPLFDYIVTALKGSRVFKFGPDAYSDNYRGINLFNYKEMPDPWDAKTFTFTLQYTRQCEVKLPINF